MAEEVLRTRVEEGVATLWLNRPQKRNALNGALVEALLEALGAAAEDEEVRVVLLRGEGPDFCAGADLAELARTIGEGEEASLEEARRLGELFLRIRYLPKPVVAAIHGRALAGGCGLATACDLILAREDAELGYPEVHLGFVPAMVMAILRRKLSEGLAFELVARGERISAREAHRLGLVNRLIPAAEFSPQVEGYARALARTPASALALTKGLLYELDHLPFAAGIERGARVNVEARMTEACREGVEAFLRRSGK